MRPASADLALRADDPSLLGIAAALALDRQDFAEAQRLIDRALELGPAESYLLVVKAEIAVQMLPAEQARGIVAETAASARGNPLVFLQYELARLDEALTAKSAAAPVPTKI